MLNLKRLCKVRVHTKEKVDQTFKSITGKLLGINAWTARSMQIDRVEIMAMEFLVIHYSESTITAADDPTEM